MFEAELVPTYCDISMADLERVARDLIAVAGNVRVWAFHGEIGAGKTTLIKTIGRVLGVTDEMSSPTFSIVNEYQGTSGLIYHFDFYRIKNEGEAYDIGIDEYFDSGHYCFVEWPEKIANLIPVQHVAIHIDSTSEISNRTIAITVHDGQEENRV